MALGFISLQNLARNVRVITLAAMVLGIPLVYGLLSGTAKENSGF